MRREKAAPPPKRAFSRSEWRIIQRHRTPVQVQQWLFSLHYNTEQGGRTLRSFRSVVRHGQAHCLEGALAAAVVLEQHGFPPLLLDIESQDQLDHVLLLYCQDGRWGTVAKSRDPGLHGRKPVFATVRQLVRSYVEPFIDLTGRITAYGMCDLAVLGRYDWRLSARNVWKVSRHLIEMPHRPLRTSDRSYRRWHERYVAYKRRYPTRKPIYYPNRRTWTPGYPKGQ